MTGPPTSIRRTFPTASVSVVDKKPKRVTRSRMPRHVCSVCGATVAGGLTQRGVHAETSHPARLIRWAPTEGKQA